MFDPAPGDRPLGDRHGVAIVGPVGSALMCCIGGIARFFVKDLQYIQDLDAPEGKQKRSVAKLEKPGQIFRPSKAVGMPKICSSRFDGINAIGR